jgi:hypothetical protein
LSVLGLWVAAATLWTLESSHMKTHAIHWKSDINGNIGTSKILFEKEEAERLANELNQDYPRIHHEAVPVQGEPAESSNRAQS